MTKGSFEVGVSTLWMPTDQKGGLTLFEALERVKRRGFRTVELVPGRFPRASYPNDRTSVGFYPDSVGERFMEKLTEVLTDFNTVTVHSPHMELNIASLNDGIREESLRQFYQCVDIGKRLGADVVTFHHGGAVNGTNPRLEKIIDYNVQFGREALRRAGDTDIQLGFEILGGALADREFELLKETILRIGSDKFGINLDVGHVNIVNGGNAVEWAREFGDSVKEIHLHGTYYRSDREPGFTTHSPVSQEDCIIFEDLFSVLEEFEFGGPIITEIHAPDLGTYLDYSVEAKEMVGSFIIQGGIDS